jgi:hypothetical protein
VCSQLGQFSVSQLVVQVTRLAHFYWLPCLLPRVMVSPQLFVWVLLGGFEEASENNVKTALCHIHHVLEDKGSREIYQRQ